MNTGSTHTRSTFRFPPKDAAAFDGSGYHAVLRTGPEFGCIKWEQKKESEPQGGN